MYEDMDAELGAEATTTRFMLDGFAQSFVRLYNRVCATEEGYAHVVASSVKSNNSNK
jgi:hypothetical protein